MGTSTSSFVQVAQKRCDGHKRSKHSRQPKSCWHHPHHWWSWSRCNLDVRCFILRCWPSFSTPYARWLRAPNWICFTLAHSKLFTDGERGFSPRIWCPAFSFVGHNFELVTDDQPLLALLHEHRPTRLLVVVVVCIRVHYQIQKYVSTQQCWCS